MLKKFFIKTLFLLLSLYNPDSFAFENFISKLSEGVNKVDLKKYAGKWYEIASKPTIYQRNCKCTTAEYKVTDDFLTVKYKCIKKNKREVTKIAKAFVIDKASNKKFKLQFHKPISHYYWIYYVSNDYQKAIVGTPNKSKVWLLARTPTISKDEYEALRKKMDEQGFMVGKIMRTYQECNL